MRSALSSLQHRLLAPTPSATAGLSSMSTTATIAQTAAVTSAAQSSSSLPPRPSFRQAPQRRLTARPPPSSYTHFLAFPVTDPQLIDNYEQNFKRAILDDEQLCAENNITEKTFVSPAAFHLTAIMLALHGDDHLQRCVQSLQHMRNDVQQIVAEALQQRNQAAAKATSVKFASIWAFPHNRSIVYAAPQSKAGERQPLAVDIMNRITTYVAQTLHNEDVLSGDELLRQKLTSHEQLIKQKQWHLTLMRGQHSGPDGRGYSVRRQSSTEATPKPVHRTSADSSSPRQSSTLNTAQQPRFDARNIVRMDPWFSLGSSPLQQLVLYKRFTDPVTDEYRAEYEIELMPKQ